MHLCGYTKLVTDLLQLSIPALQKTSNNNKIEGCWEIVACMYYYVALTTRVLAIVRGMIVYF
jgi:hypothetical protein